MLKYILSVFLAGWVGWFWMDKGRSGDSITLGGDDILVDFQFATDLIRMGELGAAFSFVWPHHFIVLSLLGGILLSLLTTGIKRFFARSRWRARNLLN